MRNYAENSRRMEQQKEYRRRKQLKKLQRNIFLVILVMILAWYGMRIRELGIYLTEVQTTLKQIEALQQKAAENQTGSDAAKGIWRAVDRRADRGFHQQHKVSACGKADKADAGGSGAQAGRAGTVESGDRADWPKQFPLSGKYADGAGQ